MTYAVMCIDELRRLVRYDADTGKLTWLERGWDHCPRDGGKRWNGRYAGKEAFRVTPSGYRYGMIKRRMFRAHRVAWALHYGEWPDMEIDHINGDRADNRIANLRLVTRAENSRNQSSRKNSKSGIVGVCQIRKKWRAFINLNGKPRHLGVFDTIEEAIAVRKAAERRAGYHPNHGRPKCSPA
jgi:hypothetical protein